MDYQHKEKANIGESCNMKVSSSVHILCAREKLSSSNELLKKKSSALINLPSGICIRLYSNYNEEYRSFGVHASTNKLNEFRPEGRGH